MAESTNLRQSISRTVITENMVIAAAKAMHDAYQPDEGDDPEVVWVDAMRSALTAAFSLGVGQVSFDQHARLVEQLAEVEAERDRHRATLEIIANRPPNGEGAIRAAEASLTGRIERAKQARAERGGRSGYEGFPQTLDRGRSE